MILIDVLENDYLLTAYCGSRCSPAEAHAGMHCRPLYCQGLTVLALPQYLGALAEYSCDHQFRCGCRGPWRNLFEGDELSSTQKLKTRQTEWFSRQERLGI